MKRIFNIRTIIGILFIALIIALHFLGIGDYINIGFLQEKRLTLLQFVQEQYVWAVLIYILAYIAIITFALPLTAASTIVGGYLFGVLPAVLYANIGATIGGTLFFLLVRYAFGDVLQEKYQDKLQWVNKEMELYGVFYLIAIHFLAIIPFSIVNLLIGLTKTPVWTFIWTTSLGVIPGSFVYAYAGRQLTKISSVRDVFSLNVLIAFVLLALMALLPIIAKRRGWLGLRGDVQDDT